MHKCKIFVYFYVLANIGDTLSVLAYISTVDAFRKSVCLSICLSVFCVCLSVFYNQNKCIPIYAFIYIYIYIYMRMN